MLAQALAWRLTCAGVRCGWTVVAIVVRLPLMAAGWMGIAAAAVWLIGRAQRAPEARA